jgi:hypothetical protein
MKRTLNWVLALAMPPVLFGFITSATRPSIQVQSDAQASVHYGTVLKIGEKSPTITGFDQFGKERDFENLKGPKGLVVLFFRSADW